MTNGFWYCKISLILHCSVNISQVLYTKSINLTVPAIYKNKIERAIEQLE